MRLSITNASLDAKFGYKQSLKMIKDAGFDAVDFSMSYWKDNDFFTEDCIEKTKEIREYMDSISLECAQTHGPFPFMYYMTPDLSEKKFEKVTKAIECTAILGAPYIIIHSIEMPKEQYGDMWDANYRYYKALQPYAEKFGVKIAVENLYIEDEKRAMYHAPGRFSDPKIMCDFIKALDSDVFCTCLDTGHSALCGIEPWMFVDNMEHKEYIQALHVHDVDYFSDTHTIPFNITNKLGGINWERTMHALYEAGYKGDLNLEANKFHMTFPDELIPDALALSAKVGRYLMTLFK